MKNLLVVDDEKNFLLSLADMFGQHSDQYALHTALNGIEAIEVLNEKEIDLVVTDLKMPEMDGFALIAHMTASHPDTPIIVMTAFPTPENTNRLDTLGLFQHIEKPIEFSSLHDKIKQALKNKNQGHVAGVSLASFLQLVGLDSKTCTLRITSKNRNGVYYFQDGELLDALFEELSGEEAAIEISGWHPVEIYIEESCRKNEKVIESPLGYILIEGARRKDEETGVSTHEKEPEGKGDLIQPQSESPDEDDVFIDLANPEDNQTVGPGEGSDSPEKTQQEKIIVDTPNLDLSETAGNMGQDTDSQTTTSTAEQELTDLLPKIKKAFTVTIGPRGNQLMQDTIEKWGKYGPMAVSRLDELVDLLCTEIDDEDLEHFFRLKIAKLL